jgi:hypothetical protein
MSISLNKFEEIKIKYGHMSSWALWKEKDIKEKSNVGDISIFKSIFNEPSLLNPNIIFVGLNISQKIIKPLSNFHSESSRSHDYKIRYALKDSKLSGGYMTDIIKDFEEKVSGNLMKYLNKNPLFLEENIKSFEEELLFIGSNNPIIIAFGNDCYKILNRHLKKYKIYKVSHYSSCISKEKLQLEIQNIIKDIYLKANT